ncbi:hypothetical protein HK405_007251 [Cladochytrium tenue]|nr:hypothetical protein HK405_007251 [Cladochytrium tenue]
MASVSAGVSNDPGAPSSVSSAPSSVSSSTTSSTDSSSSSSQQPTQSLSSSAASSTASSDSSTGSSSASSASDSTSGTNSTSATGSSSSSTSTSTVTSTSINQFTFLSIFSQTTTHTSTSTSVSASATSTSETQATAASTGINMGAVAGAVVAAIVFIIAAGFATWVYVKRSKRSFADYELNDDPPPPPLPLKKAMGAFGRTRGGGGDGGEDVHNLRYADSRGLLDRAPSSASSVSPRPNKPLPTPPPLFPHSSTSPAQSRSPLPPAGVPHMDAAQQYAYAPGQQPFQPGFGEYQQQEEQYAAQWREYFARNPAAYAEYQAHWGNPAANAAAPYPGGPYDPAVYYAGGAPFPTTADQVGPVALPFGLQEPQAPEPQPIGQDYASTAPRSTRRRRRRRRDFDTMVSEAPTQQTADDDGAPHAGQARHPSLYSTVDGRTSSLPRGGSRMRSVYSNPDALIDDFYYDEDDVEFEDWDEDEYAPAAAVVEAGRVRVPDDDDEDDENDDARRQLEANTRSNRVVSVLPARVASPSAAAPGGAPQLPPVRLVSHDDDTDTDDAGATARPPVSGGGGGSISATYNFFV